MSADIGAVEEDGLEGLSMRRVAARLGVQAPAASWGSMLNNAQSYIGEASWLAMFPGILILLTVFSFNVLGDVFRTAFEPGANRDE